MNKKGGNTRFALDWLYAQTIAKIILDETLKPNVLDSKLLAANTIFGRARGLLERGFLERIVKAATEKKINFLMQATTIKDIEEIVKLSKPHFNAGDNVSTGPFHVEEEELLMWSITSLDAPLVNYAEKRYMQLFRKHFPEHADVVDGFC